MDELHDTLDKLFTEIDHLDRIMGRDDLPAESVELALSVAKRVRRQSTLLITALAKQRDSQEAHANE